MEFQKNLHIIRKDSYKSKDKTTGAEIDKYLATFLDISPDGKITVENFFPKEDLFNTPELASATLMDIVKVTVEVMQGKEGSFLVLKSVDKLVKKSGFKSALNEVV